MAARIDRAVEDLDATVMHIRSAIFGLEWWVPLPGAGAAASPGSDVNPTG